MSVPFPDKLSVPLWTLTVPLLLKLVEIDEVDAAPPLVTVARLFTAAVVPDPLCRPPDNDDNPLTVSVPLPLKRPPLSVKEPTVAFVLAILSVPPLSVSAVPRLATLPLNVAVPPLAVVAPDTL